MIYSFRSWLFRLYQRSIYWLVLKLVRGGRFSWSQQMFLVSDIAGSGFAMAVAPVDKIWTIQWNEQPSHSFIHNAKCSFDCDEQGSWTTSFGPREDFQLNA